MAIVVSMRVGVVARMSAFGSLCTAKSVALRLPGFREEDQQRMIDQSKDVLLTADEVGQGSNLSAANIAAPR